MCVCVCVCACVCVCVCLLVCFGLWHVKPFRLLFAKAIFIQTFPFQTIQLGKRTLFVKKTFLFQAIQFSQKFLIQTIQIDINIIFDETVQSQTIQFSAQKHRVLSIGQIELNFVQSESSQIENL